MIRRLISLLRFRHASLLKKVLVYLGFLAIAVYTLPGPLAGVNPTLDGSAVLAMQLIPAQGLLFGRDIVFSWGPLLHLFFPLFVNNTLWISAVIFVDILHTIFFVSLAAYSIASQNRLLTILLLAPLSIFISALQGFYELASVIVILSYLLLSRRTGWKFSPLLGVFAAGCFFMKPDMGFVAFVAVIVGTIWLFKKGSRRLATSLVIAYATFIIIIGLILTGGFSGFLQFIKGYFELTLGYNDAMAIDLSLWHLPEGHLSSWFLLFPLASSILLLIIVVREIQNVRARLLIALSTGLLFMTYKYGYVRADLHIAVFFSMWALFFLLIQGTTKLKSTRLAAVLMAAILLVSAGFVAGNSPNLSDSINLVQGIYGPGGLSNLPSTIHLLVNQREAEASFLDSVYRARQAYPLSNATLSIIRGHTVDVLPWDVALVYAYGLNWDPAPEFQAFLAYTPYLDELNARHYNSSSSPDYVLLKPETIDNRYWIFDEPYAYLNLGCNYAPTISDGGFIILEKREGTICDKPEYLSTKIVSFGERVETPSTNGLVIARVFIQPSLTGRLVSLLYKISQVSVKLDFQDGTSQTHRLVAGTASDGLMLSVPPLLTGQMGSQPIRALTFSAADSYQYQPTIKIDFYRVPLGNGTKRTALSPNWSSDKNTPAFSSERLDTPRQGFIYFSTKEERISISPESTKDCRGGLNSTNQSLVTLADSNQSPVTE